MIEKDTIKELFSKSFENQTASVNSELWSGIQAKMAAAGVASTATVATKGISALTKWLIGSAAVGTIGVVATVASFSESKENTAQKSKQQVEQTTSSEKSETASLSEEKVNTENQQNTTPDNKIFQPNHSEISDAVHPQEVLVDDLESDNQVVETKVIEPKKIEPLRLNPEKPVIVPPKTADVVASKLAAPVALEAKVTHFPNVFTPNGDGFNDTYKISVENIQLYRLVIMDQKNRIVFDTTDATASWDGTFGGDKAESGTYAAIVTGKDASGKNFKDIQLFDLIR